MTKLKLFGYLLSPYAQRVRFAVEALNIPYEYLEVDLFAGKQREQEFKEINSLGKVPVVQFEDNFINESMVILEFLENQFGNVFPSSNIRKSQQRIWGTYFDRKIADKLWNIWTLAKTKDEEQIIKFANEISEEIRYFTKNSGLLAKIHQNPSCFFEGDSQLTFVDFIIAPLVSFLELSYSLLFKKPFYSIIKIDEEIEAFRQYSQNLINCGHFKTITSNKKSFDNSSIVSKLQLNEETYDYGFVLVSFMEIIIKYKSS